MWPSGLRHELAKFTDLLESHRFESYHFRMTHFVHSSLNHKDIWNRSKFLRGSDSIRSKFHTRQSFPSFLKYKVFTPMHPTPPYKSNTDRRVKHSRMLFRKNKIFRRSLSNRWHLRSSTQYGMSQRRFHTNKVPFRRMKAIRAKRIHLYVPHAIRITKSFDKREFKPCLKDDSTRSSPQSMHILRKRMVENGIDICYTRKGRRMVPVALPCLPCRRIQKRSKSKRLSYQELDLRITSPVKHWWPTTRKLTHI